MNFKPKLRIIFRLKSNAVIYQLKLCLYGPDWNRSESNRTGSAYVYMEPFGTDPSVYTGSLWNRSGRNPRLNMQYNRYCFGSIWIRSDPFGIGSRTVPCKQKTYPVRFSYRIHLYLSVQCKHSLIENSWRDNHVRGWFFARVAL